MEEKYFYRDRSNPKKGWVVVMRDGTFHPLDYVSAEIALRYYEEVDVGVSYITPENMS